MRVVYGADETIAIWVSSRIAGCPDFADRITPAGERLFHAIGVVDEANAIIAGIVFHNYLPEYGNIEISMAARTPQWARPEIIEEFLRYPFTQLGCQRVTTLTPARNKRALKFNKRLGFVQEGILRRGYGDDDMIVNGMLREEFEKWVESHGQENTESTGRA